MNAPQPASQSAPPTYLDYTGRDDVLSGGVRLIPVETPKGTFRVWTKRIGNSPRMRVLLMHGGPVDIGESDLLLLQETRAANECARVSQSGANSFACDAFEVSRVAKYALLGSGGFDDRFCQWML